MLYTLREGRGIAFHSRVPQRPSEAHLEHRLNEHTTHVDLEHRFNDHSYMCVFHASFPSTLFSPKSTELLPVLGHFASVWLFNTYMYTVNHKKGGSTFVIITLENLDRFLQFLHCCKEEEILLLMYEKGPPHLHNVRTLPCKNKT